MPGRPRLAVYLALAATWAASRRSTSTASSPSAPDSVRPSSSSTSAATSAAWSGVDAFWAAPLCAMAVPKRPAARGEPSSVPTLMPPADSPKIVTRAGSPPNWAMLSRTHSRAAIWSPMPALPASA